ncbi:MAG: putative repeat protein (TIGR01451 family), partial [Thalassolituus oleivorans]
MYAVNTPSASNQVPSDNYRFGPARAPKSTRSSSPSWIIPVLSFLISVFMTLLLTADAVFAQYSPYSADVQVEIEANHDRRELGQEVTFTVKATNLGPNAAPTVWVWFDTYDTEQCFEVTEVDGNAIAYGFHLPVKWGASLGAPVPNGNDWTFAMETFTVKGKIKCDSPFWFTGNGRISEITGAVDPDLSNNGPAVAEVHGTEADLDLMVFQTRSKIGMLMDNDRLDLETGTIGILVSEYDFRFTGAGVNIDPLNMAEVVLLPGVPFGDVTLADIAGQSFGTSNINGIDEDDTVLIRTATGAVFKVGNITEDAGKFNFEYEELLEEEPKVKDLVHFRVKLTNIGPDRSRDIKVLIEEDDPHGCFELVDATFPYTFSGNFPQPVNPFGDIEGTLTLLDPSWLPLPVQWKLSLVKPSGPHNEILDMEYVDIVGRATCGDSFGIKAKVIDDGTAHDPSPQGYVKATVEGVGNADLQITKEVVSFDSNIDGGVAEFVIKVKNLGPEPATWVQIKDLYDPNIMTFDRAYWNLDDEQFAFTPPTYDDQVAGEHTAIWKIDKILRGQTRELRIKFFCDLKTDLKNTAMLASLDQFDTNPDNDMDMAVVVKLDLGDAPAPYKTLMEDNGARHRLIQDAPMLGAFVDVDNDGAPSDDGQGDDTLDGTPDDEDSLPDDLVFIAGTDHVLNFPYVSPSSDALLNIWVDFNDDGDWDDWGEHPIHNQVLPQTLPTGLYALATIPVLPTSVNTKQTFMRLRICSNNMECNAYIGMAEDGEVEDYTVEISSLDFGDADFAAQTVLPDGAMHLITGLTLGEMIDSDPDGQPSADADGDDTDGDFDGNGDDEDGITFLILNGHGKASFYKGALNSLIANVGGNTGGYLSVFLDYNLDDGQFGTGAEIVVNDLWVNPGDNFVSFELPATGEVDENAFVRFRLCAKPDECNIPTGKAKSGGEVEDYVVCLLEPGSDLIVKSDGQLGSVTLDGEDRVVVANKDNDILFRDHLADLESGDGSLGFDGRLTVMGLKADDYLYVDPDAIPAGTLMAMLGDGFDTLELGENNDRRETVKHLFDGPNDGSIELTDAAGAKRVLFYSGLDPIIDNVKPAHRIFAFNGGAEDIVVRDNEFWGDGYSFIDSDHAEEVMFYGPTKTIQVMAGTGEDTIDFQGLDALMGKNDAGNMFKNFSTVTISGNDDADYFLITPINKDLFTVNVQGDHPLMCYGDVLDIREDWKGTIASLGEMNGGMGTVTFSPYSSFGPIDYTGIEALADYKADLAIATIVDPEWKMFYPGDAVEVTVKVTNLGHDKAQCVSVPDILDEALSVYAGAMPSVGMLATTAPRWFDGKTGENDPTRDDWVIRQLLPGDMASFTAKAVVNSQLVRNLDV